ncbi:hypothetical protein GDO78_010828 [Eleutherodactylus coqui]|uniref:legumain n=1 Tax=Eleutherodactylus coqui TaxID=57060 RepID=A0A8J6F789_ELECQ|nr:hypothetical protein GDO78_010828 [Eleutherodactylus coqui]
MPIEDPEDGGKHWVILVAGSNGWYNYRHQADLCHAYQIVKKNGVPDEQIVVMMYDDIANNEENPTKGIVINRPNGTDVYAGVLKDYTGEDVTPANFLAVLKGDSKAVKGKGSGKVIKSGPNDNVFVYFTDHGAPGLLAFPSDDLHVEDLNVTIQYMYENKKYKKEDLKKETLHEQFVLVKKHTNTSHVMQYGNRTISHMKVKQFQGSGKTVAPRLSLEPVKRMDLTPSPDVPMAILKRKFMATNDKTEAKDILHKIRSLQEAKSLIKESVKKIVILVTESEELANDVFTDQVIINDMSCYRSAAEHFKMRCFNWHFPLYEYAMRQLYVLVNLCEFGYPLERIQHAMDNVCENLN